jgi:hypothetical protein
MDMHVRVAGDRRAEQVGLAAGARPGSAASAARYEWPKLIQPTAPGSGPSGAIDGVPDRRVPAGVAANSLARLTDSCGENTRSKPLSLRSDQGSPVSARRASNKHDISASLGILCGRSA